MTVQGGSVRDASFAGDTAVVAGWTLVSRATGFIRVVTVAAVLGPTYFGNAFQAMNVLPNFTYELLAGGLISALLVPSLVARLGAADLSALRRIANGFLGALLVLFGAVVLALVLAAPLVARLLGIGIRDEAAQLMQQRATWPLLVLVAPQLLLYGVVGTAAAVQNALGRFALPAAAPVVENLGVVATLLVSAAVYGTGGELEAVSAGQIVLLGAGCTASVAAHAMVQWLGARSCGVALRPVAGWKDPAVRDLGRLAVPSLGTAGLIGLRYLGILIVAGSIPGGVVAFMMALNFFNLPIALGAKPVATTLLPRLAARVGDLAEAGRELARGMELALFLTVPAAVAFVVLGHSFARAAAFGEMASDRGVQLLALSLVSIGLGIVGETIVTVGTPSAYAFSDARSPLGAVAVRTCIVVPGMLCSLLLFEGAGVLVGLGASLAVGDLVAGGLLWRALRARLGSVGSLVGPLLRSGLASLGMAAFALPVAVMVNRVAASQVTHVVAALTASLVGLAVYGLLQRVLGAPEVSLLSGRLIPRRSAT